MATSTRGGSSSGKEKRGMSPSRSTIKKTLKPLDDDKSNSPTNSSKSVPSYLRSPKSLSLDPNKQPKKPSTDASVSKPTYTRRRSFDRPPPSSQVQRAIRGGTTGAHDIKTQRSSSFSHKSANSPSARPSSEKLYARTSSLKDRKVEPNLSKSQSVKKSNLSPSTKKEPTTTYKKKASEIVASESSVNFENRPSVDHSTLEDDLANLDDHEVQSLPEMSEMPEESEELSDPTNEKEEDDPHGSTLEHVQHDDEEKPMVVDQVSRETEHVDSQPVQESADAEATEEKLREVAGDQQDEAEEKAPEVEPIDTMEEEAKEEENVSLETEAKTLEMEPTEAKDESQTVSSPITDSSTPKIAQPSSAGKKDKQDYNDVIEETATKLMGGRRNKVLALAGAFETVISLEGNNKS